MSTSIVGRTQQATTWAAVGFSLVYWHALRAERTRYARNANEAAKRALASEHRDNRRAYTAAKAAVIAQLLAEAHLA